MLEHLFLISDPSPIPLQYMFWCNRILTVTVSSRAGHINLRTLTAAKKDPGAFSDLEDFKGTDLRR